MKQPLKIVDHVLIPLITGEETTDAYALGEIIVPPQAGPPLHKHVAQESFYITQGTFTFQIERGGKIEEIQASAGAAVHVPSNVPHTFTNSGKTIGKIVGVVAPANLEKFFERIGKPYKGEELKKQKPSLWQLVKIGVLAKKYGVTFIRAKKK